MDGVTKALLVVLVIIVILYVVMLAAHAEGDDDAQTDSDTLPSDGDSGTDNSSAVSSAVGLGAIIVTCTGTLIGFQAGGRVLQTLWT